MTAITTVGQDSRISGSSKPRAKEPGKGAALLTRTPDLDHGWISLGQTDLVAMRPAASERPDAESTVELDWLETPEL